VDEVVKTYPWVPVLYEETFRAHRQRVARLLRGIPGGEAIFLNDLQAAPSACGCGNTLCRWTTDYGPITTATRLPADAAARFVREVELLAPRAQVIPVWTTECEEHEMVKGGGCDGVRCFTGTCWYEYTKQLMPVAAGKSPIGVLALYKLFDRDDARFGPTASWIKQAIGSFSVMPPLRGGTSIPPDRLIPVLQGWDATPEERRAQIERARECGALGYAMAMSAIDQSWQPRVIKARAAPASQNRAGQRHSHD
jgi:hypothetical protein